VSAPLNLGTENPVHIPTDSHNVEKLWQWLKKHLCRNRLFAYLDDLMDTLAEMLINLTPTRFTELC
jgi:hypothetical protein